ncbi:MAG: glycosyltransferase family 39 protein [Elusimicrobiota bacterium]|nr:glycosyltransferase family 39 protein [Elusimicrobiota bacterium]
MKLALGLASVGALLLFARLDKPALWQDEAETALRAVTILETGLPRTHLGGVLVTAQPSLAAHEGNAAGVWTWNTWLPAYLVAASFAAFGRTPLAARLPFALAGLLTLWLSWRLFRAAEDDEVADKRPWSAEAGLAVLATSAPFLLFSRQSRYYALVSLGTVLVLLSWRALLAKRPWAALGLALSLNFLLHSSFAFFAVAALAVALDALLRFDECPRGGRFWAAAGLTLALAAPAAWYFRVWDRPGNHGYGAAEGLEFLKTFLLWGARYAVPLALPALVLVRRAALGRRAAPLLALAAGAVLLVGVAGEGAASRLAAALVLAALCAGAFAAPAPYGVMSLARMSALLLAATLGLLSFTAAEPYGRYLAGVLPVCAFLCGRWLSELGGGRAALTAALAAAAVYGGGLYSGPVRAAALAASPAPVESVSGMMRLRLRETPGAVELARFVAGLGAPGYAEAAAEAMKSGGATFFADADGLTLTFATGLKPVYDLKTEPDWVMPSPWLRLSPELDARARALLASGRYAPVPVEAPRLLWQNNPDPLFRDPAPARGPLPLWRRVEALK